MAEIYNSDSSNGSVNIKKEAVKSSSDPKSPSTKAGARFVKYFDFLAFSDK
jgi:hypothetical protein